MSSGDLDTGYAFWTAPDQPFTVTYSLAVFHEIEFQVSEGFRRIPHGGIETGGLLFGRLDENSGPTTARIEAFRTIECEHAYGPSFILSDRDLSALEDQIVAAASDPELEGMRVLGWFVAHTRSPLEVNEREVALFARLFPEPGRILLLVKPERFQATRFAFIVRGPEGRLERDGTANAIILPLPGRAGRASQGPVPSIPAPPQSAAPASASRPSASSPAPPEIPSRLAEVAGRAPESSEASFWRDVTDEPPSEPIVRIEEAQPTESLEPRVPDVLDPGRSPSALPPIEEIRRRRIEHLHGSDPDSPRAGRERVTRKIRNENRPSALRVAALLLLAAALGCGVGYIAYKQLPSATVPLTVRRQVAASAAPGTLNLMVSWPPEHTKDAIFASIRVDDGEGTPLSSQQKAAGRVMLPVHGDDVKIELIAQRRWRDSRGIVRYVRAKRTSPPP